MLPNYNVIIYSCAASNFQIVEHLVFVCRNLAGVSEETVQFQMESRKNLVVSREADEASAFFVLLQLDNDATKEKYSPKRKFL